MSAATAIREAGRPKSPLTLLIEKCVEDHDVIDDACSALLAAVRDDPTLYAQLMGNHEMRAAREAISNHLTAHRRSSLQHSASDMGSSHTANKRVAALVDTNLTMLMDFYLPGSCKKLGAATKDEVELAAAAYLRSARTSGERGQWLSRVAAKLPKGKTVAEVFSEAALEKLRDA